MNYASVGYGWLFFPKCGLVSICCWVSISFKWWQQMQNNSFFAVFETWSLLGEYKHVAHAWLSLYTFASRHRFPIGLTNNLIIEQTHANNMPCIYMYLLYIHIKMYKHIWQYTSYISLRLNTSRISRPQASTSCVFNFTLAVDSLENSGCSCFTAWGMRTGETAARMPFQETSISLAFVFLLVCAGQIGVQFGWYSPQSGVVCEHEVCEITQALTFILDSFWALSTDQISKRRLTMLNLVPKKS